MEISFGLATTSPPARECHEKVYVYQVLHFTKNAVLRLKSLGRFNIVLNTERAYERQRHATFEALCWKAEITVAEQ